MVGRFSILAAGVAGALLLLFTLSAFLTAGESRAGLSTRQCQAYSDTLLAMGEAERRLAWDCTRSSGEGGRAVTWLRFEGWNRPPRYLFAPYTGFASITIAALEADGSVRMRHYRPAEVDLVVASQFFRLDLPEASATTRAYLVAFDRPYSMMLIGESRLDDDPAGRSTPQVAILIALTAGMLVMPFLFDFLAYMMLRERFVLVHSGMTMAGLVWVAAAGGLLNAFVQLPVAVLALLGQMGFAVGACLTGFFIDAFVEPDALPRRARVALRALSGLMLCLAIACSLQLPALQGPGSTIYLIAFTPMVPVCLIAIVWALLRGSRAAWFVVAAWLPIVVVTAERATRAMSDHAAPPVADLGVFVALVLEVVIFAMGIAHRLLSIRRERDRAIDRVKALKQLSERDPLTGLLNRRAIEERFVVLRQDGFTTLAVIDLDHFKRINDTFGHATGDLVLKVVGEALRVDDANMMAFRMGGEEFLLLIRGADSVQRAERQRQEIARSVAQEDLGCLVTASMGIVEVTGGALPGVSFATIYARADRLLYEAKASGRNRMACERIKAFQPRHGDRRAA